MRGSHCQNKNVAGDGVFNKKFRSRFSCGCERAAAEKMWINRGWPPMFRSVRRKKARGSPEKRLEPGLVEYRYAQLLRLREL